MFFDASSSNEVILGKCYISRPMLNPEPCSDSI